MTNHTTEQGNGPDVVMAARTELEQVRDANLELEITITNLRAELTELKNTHDRGIAALDSLADRLRAHNDQVASGVTS